MNAKPEAPGVDALIGDFGATAIEEPANSVIVLRSASEEALRASTTHPEYADGEMLRHSITSNATMITARRSGRSLIVD